MPDSLGEPALKIVVDITAAWGSLDCKEHQDEQIKLFLCHHVTLSLQF